MPYDTPVSPPSVFPNLTEREIAIARAVFANTALALCEAELKLKDYGGPRREQSASDLDGFDALFDACLENARAHVDENGLIGTLDVLTASEPHGWKLLKSPARLGCEAATFVRRKFSMRGPDADEKTRVIDNVISRLKRARQLARQA